MSSAAAAILPNVSEMQALAPQQETAQPVAAYVQMQPPPQQAVLAYPSDGYVQMQAPPQGALLRTANSFVQTPHPQQARQVVFASFPPATPTLYEDQVARHRRQRNRVLCISACIAVYVVFGGVLGCVVDVAEMESAMNKINLILNLKDGGNIFMFALQQIPSLIGSAMCALLIPLCGYIGAKQQKPILLRCFTCCNGCTCCAGCFFVVLNLVFVLALMGLEPSMEAWLEQCDPAQCASNGVKQTPPDMVIDCLAAGAFDGYQRRFVNVPAYPSVCNNFCLVCDNAVGASPSDAIELCQLDTDSMELVHDFRLISSELVPQLEGYIFLQTMIAVPAILLAGVGFYVGQDMKHLMDDDHVGSQQVSMQPALGIAVHPQVEMQMAQPLMVRQPIGDGATAGATGPTADEVIALTS
eukprot:TRINITY_DN4391_c0_g1_i1.p1 TRINITY_DN4391_c0_g1~~TRINITY_DN4391_c0_g1_i1.p1  ORF type:complete len:413 (-),score=66.92 TRINITY_DN4391_c0_g1_i1:55-1293(-)